MCRNYLSLFMAETVWTVWNLIILFTSWMGRRWIGWIGWYIVIHNFLHGGIQCAHLVVLAGNWVCLQRYVQCLFRKRCRLKRQKWSSNSQERDRTDCETSSGLERIGKTRGFIALPPGELKLHCNFGREEGMEYVLVAGRVVRLGYLH